MQIQENVSLKPYNTFGIDAKAETYCNITTIEGLKSVLHNHSKAPLFILGGGSNILLTKNIEALVLHINLKGISIEKETENEVWVKAMAGENWHSFVLWCLDRNYGGIENLSLIPGKVGTAPIQNIGAYGVELKDVFDGCQAIDIKNQTQKRFTKEDCKFQYRESVFKQTLKGKYIITSVTFKLTKKAHQLHLNYGAIKHQLKDFNIENPTIQDISKAVIAIRESKLPNPKLIGNSGSFFKNSVIAIKQFNQLQRNFPKIPSFPVDSKNVKVPTGWLIETAGFKGKRFGDYGVHEHQALVLVNYGKAEGEAILKLSKLIQKTVKRLFNITIETEVNIV